MASPNDIALEEVRKSLRPQIRPSQEGQRWAKKYTLQARARAKERRQELEERLAPLFQKHDADKTNSLDRTQITTLMKELNNADPDESEVTFVLRLGTPPYESLSWRHFTVAMEAWETYVKEFKPGNAAGEESMQKLFDIYDTDKTGKLTFEQLFALMRDLESGRTKRAPRYVSEIDVEWLISKADLIGDGQVSKKEFHLALCAWYSKLAQFDEEVLKGGGGVCCVLQ